MPIVTRLMVSLLSLGPENDNKQAGPFNFENALI
jgi:hypothetical protein